LTSDVIPGGLQKIADMDKNMMK